MSRNRPSQFLQAISITQTRKITAKSQEGKINDEDFRDEIRKEEKNEAVKIFKQLKINELELNVIFYSNF